MRSLLGVWESAAHRCWDVVVVALALAAMPPLAAAQPQQDQQPLQIHESTPSSQLLPLSQPALPPRVLQGRRFLAQRRWAPDALRRPLRPNWVRPLSARQGNSLSAATATWQPVGPAAVVTPGYGLVSGRVAALAIDPSDPTGNHVYVGTSGGGVWSAQNAAAGNPAQVLLTPLTDTVNALDVINDASISIGALTVQPGGTGVILAGTGDPNDALDSYYGAGILRSADGGNTWTAIPITADQLYAFTGEGFAGFAWSTTNPQLVVAAVSQAYEGTLVNATVAGRSYQGLYYSTDAGVTWNLSTITDGPYAIIQQDGGIFAQPDGNAVTAVVWNPVRRLFIAAVRFHGYYQSADGITFTRMAAQPGAGLTGAACPANSGTIGSLGCPIFRGALAVNPQTGDTFAWTVDIANQDQGLWQDGCGITLAGACAAADILFSKQWATQPLETNTTAGAATIANGDYNLALAAVPAAPGQGEDTWLLAGGNDLWRCSLAQGCVWRNTTNAATCMSAQVAEFQHALAWNSANPQEILVGNDGGLWRSLDAVGETGPVCSPSDATHFQNLNGGLGSLAEVQSLGAGQSVGEGGTLFAMVAGLGVNGTAGIKSNAGDVADWPQILGGYGGPVVVNPANLNEWLVNNQNGVSIYSCSDTGACTPDGFGAAPAVTDADVGGDGDAMSEPAPFLVDALDASQLLVATCRMWRGPQSGAGWSSASVISPGLATGQNGVCDGDELIRSIAAMPLASGSEVIYAGLYGTQRGGQSLPGHIFRAVFNPASGVMPAWQDLTLNPVANSDTQFNALGFDISSIVVDSHDPTGNTVYATLEAFSSSIAPVATVYGSTDGGAHWANLTSNLPWTPVSALLVDPQSASTLYIATDIGAYFTSQVSNCLNPVSYCWSVFGTGLPLAPVVALAAPSSAGAPQVLTAGTYGRGIWQTPLWSAGAHLTTATANPSPLVFPPQAFGTTSSAQTVTVTNTGSLPMASTAITVSGDFAETDTCQDAPVAPAGTCTIQVWFTPTATGARTGQMVLSVNVDGGEITVALDGFGNPAGAVTLTPASLAFGSIEVGQTSAPAQATATNTSGAGVTFSNAVITAPFSLASNTCPAGTLAAGAACQLTVVFTPVQPGLVSGTLTLTDGAGTQTVLLSGTGAAPPTDLLNPASLTFQATGTGQLSAALPVLLTNTGDLPLASIAVSTTAQFESSNTCGTQLAPHATCAIRVVFAPTALGAQAGTLKVTDALRTQTVSLSGIAVPPGMLSVTPGSLSFPSQALGTSSTPVLLTVTNGGGVSAANVGFLVGGAGASSFSVGTTTCGAALAAAASCTAQVMFTPQQAGGALASLTVSSSTVGVTPVVVVLQGSGQAPAGINVSPAYLAFADTPVGGVSAAQIVTVSNGSGVAASQLSLATGAPFTLTQNSCPATLAANTRCTVGIAFAPVAMGPASGVLAVSSPAIFNSANVPLSGTGAAAASVLITPSSISFPATGVGLSSSPVPVTVTNSGVSLSLADLSLNVSAGFQLVNNLCPSSLAPGQSCAAAVEAVPGSAGPQAGKLTVASSSIAGSATIQVTAMGFDFTVVPVGSSSQTVAAGQTATYTLAVAPLSGSSGTFSLACDALPPNALCLFSPPALTEGAGDTGSVTVQISTGSATALLPGQSTGRGLMLPLLCTLLLLPLGWRRRGRVLGAAVLLTALAFCVFGVGACAGAGGGSSGGTGGGGGGAGTTPAGTYSIPVTVTSTGISHSATLTLTVD